MYVKLDLYYVLVSTLVTSEAVDIENPLVQVRGEYYEYKLVNVSNPNWDE